GYLLTKDLITHAGDDWTGLIRPLKTIRPDESVDTTLLRMQGEGTNVYVVEEEGRPVGLVTLEDILEQVVGTLEDEYPHDIPVSLTEAVSGGGMVLALEAVTRDEAVRELINAVPSHRLPPGIDRKDVLKLALAREEEVSTDLGNGIAIPHARCPNLADPVVVIGRSVEGVVFSPEPGETAQLLFLLLTPAERPEVQLALLGQLARLAGTQANRDALLRAGSPADMLEALHRASGTPAPS
ncbi:MAG TPA: PTS sugar transporter subunit IIA, partial [Verrucomicrobiales bacterium]|nr:PTS sugar transporter subunit IIA [Verrucomicrobiales bacterium]